MRVELPDPQAGIGAIAGSNGKVSAGVQFLPMDYYANDRGPCVIVHHLPVDFKKHKNTRKN